MMNGAVAKKNGEYCETMKYYFKSQGLYRFRHIIKEA